MSLARSRAGTATGALVIASIFAFLLLKIATEPLNLNGDSALNLAAGEKLLDGGVSHIDVVDTNPPLIMYLGAVPVAVARLLGAHPVPIALLTIWVWSVAATFGAWRLLLTSIRDREAVHAHLLGATLALVSLDMFSRREFGQREYLFIYGLIPYLIVRFRTWEQILTPRSAAIAAGLFGGVATAIKPHFLVVALAPELYWMVSQRRLRPLIATETLAAGAIGVAYLGYFLFWPEVREAYFGRWAPLLMQGYGAYHAPYGLLIVLRHELWQVAALACLPVVLRGRSGDVAWRLAMPLAIATLGALALYFLQRKGWSYHAVPTQVCAYLVAAQVLSQLVVPATDDAPQALTSIVSGRVVRASLAAIIVMSGGAAVLLVEPTTQQHLAQISEDDPVARSIVHHTRPNEPVLMLATSAWEPYPLLAQLRRPQATRYLFTFPLPVLYYGVRARPDQPFPYRGANGDPPTPEEIQFRADLTADLASYRPKLVLMDVTRNCFACPDGFSVHEYFERTAFVSTEMQDYRRLGTEGRYMVYVRHDQAR